MTIPGFRIWWLQAAVGGTLLAIIGAQHWHIAELRVNVASLEQVAAKGEAERQALARRHSDEMVANQAQHAKDQQEKDDVFNQRIAALQAARSADAVQLGGLRRDLAAYSAGGGRPGETDAARAERAEDRLSSLAGLLDEGFGLVAESRELVGRRDAEVSTLTAQIAIDRRACNP